MKETELFYEAKRIVENYSDWEKYVVGCYDFTYGIRTFTAAIEKAESRIRTNSRLGKESNVEDKIVKLLKKSKDCMSKKIKCEKEIEKRLSILAREQAGKDFNYAELCHETDRVRKEVEKEFCGKWNSF